LRLFLFVPVNQVQWGSDNEKLLNVASLKLKRAKVGVGIVIIFIFCAFEK